MRAIPREPGFDSTLAFARDPYEFVSTRCRRHQSDVFQTRLLLRPTICMMGRDAAALFYDPARFIRHGAMPGRVRKTLFGRGGVQGLDGSAHRQRKAMFLSLMAADEVARLADIAAAGWRARARRWPAMSQVILYDEARTVLTRAVCAWAGVPLPERDIARRAAQLGAMFEHAGSVGLRYWAGR